MAERRIVVAGAGSGVGKTTLTIGIMAALRKKGLTVQGFKCGPDYIDPSYHTAVTQRVSRNLDSWMLTRDRLLDIFIHGSRDADISVIEGAMGYFDGKSPETNVGSAFEISQITQSPVLLVVDCEGMARSAAAIVKGFQLFTEDSSIVGVFVNKVGSEGHFQLVKKAIEQECRVPVIGYLKRQNNIEIPERHLGLIPSIERGELDPFFDQLGALVSETADIEKLLELAVAKPLARDRRTTMFQSRKETVVKIAVAKDMAFNFYYPENLEILEANGARLVYFSPLADEALPDDVDGLYLGGGFPEEFAVDLARNQTTKRSIKTLIEAGLPTLAECGGFMYLTDSIETTNNEKHEMIGAISGAIQMQDRLAALGYREITGQNNNYLLGDLMARGHEFHYATFMPKDENPPYAYQTKGLRGINKEGYLTRNVVAGFTQFHFGSNPKIVENWIKKCLTYKAHRR